MFKALLNTLFKLAPAPETQPPTSDVIGRLCSEPLNLTLLILFVTITSYGVFGVIVPQMQQFNTLRQQLTHTDNTAYSQHALDDLLKTTAQLPVPTRIKTLDPEESEAMALHVFEDRLTQFFTQHANTLPTLDNLAYYTQSPIAFSAFDDSTAKHSKTHQTTQTTLNLHRHRYQLQLSGTYPQLLTLIHQLLKQPESLAGETVSIDSVNIQAVSPQNAQLRIAMTCSYYIRPAESPEEETDTSKEKEQPKPSKQNATQPQEVFRHVL